MLLVTATIGVGPQGQPVIAQANGLGRQVALRARKPQRGDTSIPNVALVDFNSMALTQSAILLLKRHPFVMLFLVLDV